MLAPEKVTYDDLARASSETSSAEPPSVLRAIFHDTTGNDGLLAAWLTNDARDAEIDEKEATRELAKSPRRAPDTCGSTAATRRSRSSSTCLDASVIDAARS